MKSIGTRFLVLFGLMGVLFALFILYHAYESGRRQTLELVGRQTAMALEFNMAVRAYVAEHIRPRMRPLMGRDGFEPETMSTSFVSRRIFEEVQQKFPDFIIRFPSENPRNPRNLATAEERAVIDHFRANPAEKKLTREMIINGRRHLAHFRPRRLERSCMRCHGDPKNAPAELLKRYGASSGFHRTEGDIAGLDAVAVPLDAIDTILVDLMRKKALTIAVALMMFLAATVVVFRRFVTRRLGHMTDHFQRIAADVGRPHLRPVEVTGADEISVLGASFNRLIDQLNSVYASLERRVAERTDELFRMNEEMKRDIAERKKTEEALRESEERFRTIFEQSSIGVAILSRDYRFVRVNAEMCRMTGYTEDEFASLLFTDITHPEHLAADMKQVQRLVAGEIPQYVTDKRYLRKDGGVVWGSLSVRPIRDGEGAISYFLAVIVDVTERMKTEAAVRESEERFRALVQNIEDMVAIMDDKGVVIYENPAIAAKLGAPMKGRNFFDVIHPDDAPAAASGLARVASHVNLHQPVQFRMRTTEGNWIYVESLATNLTGNRFVGGILGIGRDITERKRTEEALEKSLEENRTLLRELQHRVKNSLAIITGLIGLEAGRSTDAAFRDTLTEIRNRVGALSNLYDLLFRSKEVRETRLDQYVEQMGRSLVSTYSSHEGPIELDLRLEKVYIDVKRAVPLGLILNELLTNAVKHAFPENRGGSIRVSLAKKGDELLLEISDNGRGLPPDFNVHKSGAMGLEIVRMLVSQLEGRLEVKRGKETAFCISVPAGV